MADQQKFNDEMTQGYTFEGPAITLGGAMLDGVTQTGTLVKVPMKTLNRHGLISGSTGTGKTKSLQILAEQLSQEGVPVLLMDVKGDLSGIAVPSDGHPKIDERHEAIGIPFEAGDSPVEFLTLSEEPGVRLRATLTEFGPVLFARMLDLTETQMGIMAVVFKYCDDYDIPLIDLNDLRKTLQYMTGEGKEDIQEVYGRLSTNSVSSILRKLIALEQQGADRFFGERSFDVQDLLRINEREKGVVSIVRLTDIQDKPMLFSTFMLQMMAEIYSTFPEEGDTDKPKLVIFIDEAHLVFNEASDTLLDQLEIMVKLIRSKGVGLFFVTQNPVDIPDEVLSQLGFKLQHALRAFTAKDRKAIKLAAQNFPESTYYDVSELLTQLGIGEALVTALNEKGIPTPLAHTMLRAPQSRMDVLTQREIDQILDRSDIKDIYNETINRESAEELLQAKIDKARLTKEKERKQAELEKIKRTSRRNQKTVIEQIMNNSTTRQIGRTVARELTRGLLSVLGVKK
ncbi:MAG: DUF853 family protein [Saprospiraceae bacterium]|nr:DUF853 family protein [Saprospiraceae bacterium]